MHLSSYRKEEAIENISWHRLDTCLDMRFGQIVVGPAGHGKTTYCKTIISHAETINRKVDFVNLDPANENMEGAKNIVFDVRELIKVDQVMEDEELKLGPNGGLVYAMEYLMDNTDWIKEQLGDYDDDYILFDCPGQIELHTHYDVIKRLVELLQSLNFRLCGVFILDSGFFLDAAKFFSATLCTLSTMINLEIPFLNILTKTDLLNKKAREKLEAYLEPDTNFLLLEESSWNSAWSKKYQKLTKSLSRVIDDYSLVKFVPMNMFEEESLCDILFSVDEALQFDEEREVKVKDFDME